MSMFGGMEISASALTAQRLRMNVTAENIANAETTRGADGNPYRRKEVTLEAVGQGGTFGAQAHGDAVSELIRQTYTDAVQKEKLRPAAGPRIEPIQVDPGQDLKFAAIIEVMPEVVINPVAALEIERPVFEITEEDVDAMLESMRRQRISYQPVERAAFEDLRAAWAAGGQTLSVEEVAA